MVKTEERFYIHYLLLFTGGDFLLSKKKDLTGMKFGKLTVIKMLYNYNGTHRTKCLCKCDCGNECIRAAYDLGKSELSSCGCAKKEYVRISCGKNIDGMKFGRLLVLETLWDENPPMVKCLCDCGNIVIIRKSDVQKLHTQSCGCFQREQSSKLNEVDYADVISDYGVQLLKQYKKNKHGQWLWKCKCGNCGNYFYDLPARILNGHVRSCGCLKRSSNEMFIANFLDELNVQFEEQYKFEDCKSDKGYYLYFDFAIFKDNDLLCLLEYDGKQHFIANDLFGGEKSLIETISRDNIKNKYCADNDIQIYRFPYTMSNDEIKEKIMNIIYP